MPTDWKRMTVLSLGLASALALSACASNDKSADKDKDADEIKMKIDEVPPAVKATLIREAEGTSVTNVDKETHEGKVIYEADATIGGANYEIRVADDGSLISKKLDKEDDEKSADKKEDKD